MVNNMLIYKLKNNLNGKEYIGQTTRDLSRRLTQHKSLKSNKCPYLKNAISKYGFEVFSVEILDKAESVEKLNELEIFYISKHNTLHPNGYNLKSGGENGGKWSDESRKRASDSAKGRKHSEETKLKISNLISGKNHPMFGKHHTDETKKRLSENNSGSKSPLFGIPRSEDIKRSIGEKAKSRGANGTKAAVDTTKKKIVCIQNNNVYESFKQASKDLNISRISIRHILQGKKKSVKGLTFKYLGQ